MCGCRLGGHRRRQERRGRRRHRRRPTFSLGLSVCAPRCRSSPAPRLGFARRRRRPEGNAVLGRPRHKFQRRGLWRRRCPRIQHGRCRRARGSGRVRKLHRGRADREWGCARPRSRADHQAARAGRRSFGLSGEGNHGRDRIEFASELFAKPVAQGSAGGEARRRCVLAGKDPLRVPDSPITDSAGSQCDDEDGGAIRNKHVAGIEHADADGF